MTYFGPIYLTNFNNNHPKKITLRFQQQEGETNRTRYNKRRTEKGIRGFEILRKTCKQRERTSGGCPSRTESKRDEELKEKMHGRETRVGVVYVKNRLLVARNKLHINTRPIAQ